MPPKFRPTADRPGGCYTCRHFGERVDPAVRCARPGGEHVRSQAERGCAFWEREPGADGRNATIRAVIEISTLRPGDVVRFRDQVGHEHIAAVVRTDGRHLTVRTGVSASANAISSRSSASRCTGARSVKASLAGVAMSGVHMAINVPALLGLVVAGDFGMRSIVR
jgi:hypothetical protein